MVIKEETGARTHLRLYGYTFFTNRAYGGGAPNATP